MDNHAVFSNVAPPEPDAVTYSIRYEGGDAERHELDLNQLGLSLQGFARILAVCAHAANTGRYNKQFDALSVRVYAAPVQEHRCYEVLTTIREYLSTKDLWSGFGGVVVTLLVQYVFNRNKEEEMKHLSEALRQAMGQNASMVDKLLGTIDKMADALRPAAKQALQPIGGSCRSIGIYKAGAEAPALVLDQGTKDHLAGNVLGKILPTAEYGGLISEMDMETGSCRVSLEGDETSSRIAATITDPLGRAASNPYALAMAQIHSIRFLAKAEVDPEGVIVKLYISDVATPAKVASAPSA